MSLSPGGDSRPIFWLPNPFTAAAVGSVWETDSPDVPDIHAEAFSELQQMVAQRRSGIRDRCALLYGSPGSGKTHLIRRLRFALQQPAGPGQPAQPPSVFSWVRMQTSPAMMWRHLRRSLAADLVLRDAAGYRQIDHLLARSAAEIEAVETRDLSVVLEQLAAKRYQRDARAWLLGDRLPDSVLQMLGIASNDAEDESIEDESRRIIRDLAHLLQPIPLVICLDQLEALQAYPGDKAGLFAIGNLMAALHDELSNAVVVGCIQTGLLQELDMNLSEAARDRYRPLPLQPLKPDQIRALVLARLNAQPETARNRPSRASEFWPIEIARLETLAAAAEGVTPRKIIFECDQMFRAMQGRPATVKSAENFLDEEYRSRFAQAQREITRDTSSIVLSDGLPRILHLFGVKVHRKEIPRWMDHLAETPAGARVGVVVANDGPQRIWRKLERIAREWEPRRNRLVIYRDSLNPLSSTAIRSHERLAELEKRGATVVSPSREALAALDAARRLLADADSGDLALGGDSIGAATVEDWIRQHFPETLNPLIRPISEQSPETAAAVEGKTNQLLRDIIAQIAEQKIARVSDLAGVLNRSTQEIEACVRENPDSFGLAGGPETVVFERVPAEGGT